MLLRVTSGNQFGLDEEDIKDIVKNREQYPELNIRGVQCYTGTQKKKFDIIKSEIEWLDGLCDSLYADYGFKAEELEYGPGLPVPHLDLLVLQAVLPWLDVVHRWLALL